MVAVERDAQTLRVIEELKRLYKLKIQPLEAAYRFDLFNSPALTDAEFDAKPQVLLLGQYSVGKTTFIRYLLGEDFPGQRIGPEPTTDRFTAIFHGPDSRVIPGNALAVSHEMPFRGLERFGVSFLNRFEGATLPSPVLRSITLIDSPGVLSGEKQRIARGYDFCSVVSWFASRADLILLLFDAHKLDISDEFRATIEALRGHEDKIRCVLNKADTVDRQRLMRVYGALMWSLGKVLSSPEVLRVYIGSFWDQPLVHADNEALFAMEEADLMRDLRDLPRNSAVRKINELVKRVRLAKVHAYIISSLKEQMPMLMGHAKKQAALLNDLPATFRSLLKKYNLAPGDFPDLNDFKQKLAEHDFSKFHSLRPNLIEAAETALGVDFPRLMDALPRSVGETPAESVQSSNAPLRFETKPATPPSVATVTATLADTNPFGSPDSTNPFEDDEDEQSSWALAEYVNTYKSHFDSVAVNGLIGGASAKSVLGKLGVPTSQLRKVWELSDINRDGSLDLQEYAVAMYLIELIKQGHSLPDSLDASLLPPSK